MSDVLKNGGYIVAPCSHQGECKIEEDDWCAFYTRVARSAIHRQAKKGELGYEDEKFSYMAFSITRYANVLGRPSVVKNANAVGTPDFALLKTSEITIPDEAIFSRANQSW